MSRLLRVPGPSTVAKRSAAEGGALTLLLCEVGGSDLSDSPMSRFRTEHAHAISREVALAIRMVSGAAPVLFVK